MFKPHGIIPAMVTPLDENEALNESPLRRLVNHLIEGGVHGLFAIGSQGEFWAFDAEEKRRILEVVVDEVGGRVPVYGGTAAVSTREAVALTHMAKEVLGCPVSKYRYAAGYIGEGKLAVTSPG
jgi:4-hydroxy-tetrahydrodipicolinate synthase